MIACSMSRSCNRTRSSRSRNSRTNGSLMTSAGVASSCPRRAMASTSSFDERLPADARLEDVSCRSTMCRITVRFPSAQAGEVGAELLPNLVPWDTRGILYSDEREPTRVVFYAARAPELAP